MVKGNDKGGDYERQICQRLSLWVSDGVRTDVFWRSAMSGGRATLAAKRKDGKKFDAQSGDITATHALGHHLLHFFVVDSKHYKDFGMHTVLFGSKGLLIPMWLKLVDEARGVGRSPMLISKQNYQPEIVLTDSPGALVLESGRSALEDFKPYLYFPQEDAWVYALRELFSGTSYASIRKANEAPSNI